MQNGEDLGLALGHSLELVAQHEDVEKLKQDAAQRYDQTCDRLRHVAQRYGQEVICRTDTRGQAEPFEGDPRELVVNANEGFIPLWDQGVTLRWRFQEQSMAVFVDPDAAKAYFRNLLGEALILWSPAAVPVKFKEANDAWDFELVFQANRDCDARGCTLASAFFPDGGRHELVLYPDMLQQTFSEQIETMAHELGHVFGLRHFFALLNETAWPAEVFGSHNRFSIMNYGSESAMTSTDRSDLRTLYRLARSGALREINGTPIRLVRPFSDARVPANDPCAAGVMAASAPMGLGDVGDPGRLEGGS